MHQRSSYLFWCCQNTRKLNLTACHLNILVAVTFQSYKRYWERQTLVEVIVVEIKKTASVHIIFPGLKHFDSAPVMR